MGGLENSQRSFLGTFFEGEVPSHSPKGVAWDQMHEDNEGGCSVVGCCETRRQPLRSYHRCEGYELVYKVGQYVARVCGPRVRNIIFNRTVTMVPKYLRQHQRLLQDQPRSAGQALLEDCGCAGSC